jgi:two-component sensor histidine kinase
LNALAAAHSLLTQRSWDEPSIRDLVASAVGAAAGADRARVTLDGPDIALSPQTAVSMSMILHELTTNAIKYGALSVPAGGVAIDWRMEGSGGDAQLHLKWVEHDGPPVTAPATAGFGTRLIRRGLSVDGRGSVELAFLPGGVECSIVAGLPA